ncbi:MAG TPA: ATP-binding protein [Patescibacteria group bacterium]|nr:ATP-binding protein [Patescibacteria group bacterium]
MKDLAQKHLNRLVFHLITIFYFVSLYLLTRGIKGTLGVSFFPIIGSFIVIVSIVACAVSLIKFDTRNKSKYAFIGFGFLGASVLDFYFYLVKPTLLLSGKVSDPATLLLSLIFFLSYLVWTNESIRNVGHKGKLKNQIFLLSMFFSIFLTISFLFVKIPALIAIAVSSALLLVTIFGYLTKGTWKKKFFDQVFITALIALLLSQIPFYLASANPGDLMFYMSVLIRLVSYILALTGLLLSTHNAFVLAEDYGKSIEATLVTSIDSMPVGYILLDKDGAISRINNKVKKLFSTENLSTIKQILTKNFDVEKVQKSLDKSEELVYTKDVTYINRIFSLIAANVERGTDTIGTVILLEDVTDERLLERSKDEFIALASHELRTPLVAIKGNVDLIKNLYPAKVTEKDLAEMVQDIDTSAARLIAIVDELLEVSSLEHNRVQFKTERFSVSDEVNAVLGELASPATKKGNLIEYHEDKDIKVYADRTKVNQVIYNLVSNSNKFTDNGRITIKVLEEKDSVKINVSDTGRGMSEKDQKMLFKKFQQVGEDFYKHDSTQGVGLGLYISRMLADAMNGKVYLVKSKVDKGSEFELVLPKG